MKNLTYTNSLTEYSRLKTRVVTIGDIPLGGTNPIRVQSMTTTDTLDTIGTVEQSIRMIEAGCEYVRITAPSLKEAQNLENIKKELHNRGFNTPLIADIHYTPNAAELAARIVEKVRVNPGNYADKKKFENIEYTDESYTAELERIRERFIPLVRICKEYGTAMRIGTNHGSLSDRILSRYGDTPLGMVESALEFLRICEDENYHNIVLSMKASNPQVMIQAYRLLVNKMLSQATSASGEIDSERIYPLHLGVTEAGDGEDGRIKSAVGIGALLEDGLGDTVRVSLTEDPEFEIPVAKELISRYQSRKDHQPILPINENSLTNYTPFEFQKRVTFEVHNVGGDNIPRVIADMSNGNTELKPANLFGCGYIYNVQSDKWNLTDLACDYIYCGKRIVPFEIPGTLGIIYDHTTWQNQKQQKQAYPYFNSLTSFLETPIQHPIINLIETNIHELSANHSKLSNLKNGVILLNTKNEHAMPELRRAFFLLNEHNISIPCIIKREYNSHQAINFSLYSGTDCGPLFTDGFGNGIWLNIKGSHALNNINNTAFGILQATRSRITKTEYISCPSCGRTLFDLQETTARIRKVTDHLKGVKIGIMGCIVNGPGEMADADYGYVGTGIGKITLYKGKEVVERNINSEKAVDALVGLIKKHGDWVEKEV